MPSLPFIRPFLGYLLPTFLAVGIVYGYLHYAVRKEVTLQAQHRLLWEARLIQAYLEAMPPRNTAYDVIDAVADRLSEQSGARVTIIAADGAVMGDSSIPLPDVPDMENHGERPEVQAAFKGETGESLRYSQTLKTDMVYVAVPFIRNGRIEGAVRLALPLRDFGWIERHEWRLMLLLACVGTGCAVLLGYATAHFGSKPVRRMTAVARRLAEGDVAASAAAPSAPEWRDLTAVLNGMAGQSRARLSKITEEKAQLEAVLSAMTEGVMVTDAGGRIVHFNPAFTRMMRVNAWGLNKRPIEVIRSADLQAAVDAALDAETHAERAGGLNLTFTRDDRTFQVHLTSIRIDRAFHGVVAVFHDVTELRRLEQVRRDFVANVSHELRTPLTSIKGYTETLMDGALEDASTARKFIASIQHHTTRLQALVEDLLQLSRIESGRIEVRFRPCFLEPIARRVLEALDERCTRKRLTLGFDCRMGLPVRGDDALLELVLFNLLDNAIKYTPEGGSVTLRLFQEQNEGILAVADTGVGIPSEALPRIFERFYRVDRVRSREQGGTGLGLSIVKHTMDRLQGRVWVESAVGSGSTFYIALPVWQEGPEEAKEPSGATPHQSPEGP